MSIIRAIKQAYLDKERKGWDRMYFFFDIHGTIIRPNYKYGDIPTEFYPNALETLRLISKLKDVVMVAYTCSHEHEIEQYLKIFKDNDIHFHYVNENPEVVTQPNGYGCYEKKPYMNVLFEDKAGFYGEEDWLSVYKYLMGLDADRYEYKGKPYKKLADSKIKIGDLWLPVVIYECQYENNDGKIWVREENQFLQLFKQL